MTRDELGRRLAARIESGYCWACEGPFDLFEEIRGGEGRLTCTLPPGACGLVFHLDKVGFPFLRQRTSVDWLVLVHLPDGWVDAHLVEFKTTVNAYKWHETKGQMTSSVTRARALAGALQAPIRGFFSCTAYRNDLLSARCSPDPVFARLPIGSGAVARGEPEETRNVRAGALDWQVGAITLDGLDGPVPHRRAPLDPASGVGQVELASSQE